MGTTTTYSGLRIPVSTDAPNIAQFFSNLGSDLDQKVTVTVASSTARNALSSKYDGMRVYEQSSQRTFRWNATNSRWDYVNGPWYTWTPTLTTTGGTAVTASPLTTRGSYVIAEGRIRFNVGMSFAGAINGQSGALVVQMPASVVSKASNPEQDTICSYLYSAFDGAIYSGGGVVTASASTVAPFFPRSSSNCSMAAFMNATGPGVTGSGVPLVSGSYPLTNGSILNVWGEYELASWPAL